MGAEQLFHVGVKALVMNDKSEILVLKANPKELTQTKGGVPVHWDLPGGRVKEGDSIEVTLKKELNEELGINADDAMIGGLFDASISHLKVPVGNAEGGLMLLTYVCTLRETKTFSLSFEHTEYRWVSIEEAKALLATKFAPSFVDKLDELRF